MNKKTLENIWHVLGYTQHTPKHLPAGLFILGALLVLWLIARLRGGGSPTIAEFFSSLGVLAFGAGVVLWALRWKPAVTNATTNTYPVVNHATTSTVVVSHGQNLWQEAGLAVAAALVVTIIIMIWKRLRYSRWRP
jgi:hypothetical protein